MQIVRVANTLLRALPGASSAPAFLAGVGRGKADDREAACLCDLSKTSYLLTLMFVMKYWVGSSKS